MTERPTLPSKRLVVGHKRDGRSSYDNAKVTPQQVDSTAANVFKDFVVTK